MATVTLALTSAPDASSSRATSRWQSWAASSAGSGTSPPSREMSSSPRVRTRLLSAALCRAVEPVASYRPGAHTVSMLNQLMSG